MSGGLVFAYLLLRAHGEKTSPPEPAAAGLFEGFFVEDKDQSRTLDIYDALPKFSLSWERDTDGEKNLRVFNNVQVDGQTLKVTIAAAVLSPKKEPGAEAAGPPFTIAQLREAPSTCLAGPC